MRVLKIGGNILDIVVIAVLLSAHLDWLAPYTDGTFPGFLGVIGNLADSPSQDTIQILVVQGFYIALLVALIVVSLETIGQIYNLVRQSLGLDRLVASTDEI
jgi:hypothetical protein